MNILKKTALEEAKIESFLNDSAEKLSQLEKYSQYVDTSELANIRKHFVAKVENFNQLDRKLNIGVIGQVKAGKSTFLNTLLFNGKEVLPSAKTPKTATLTKIEYSENNSITIEYYTQDEWEELERLSQNGVLSNENEVAKEIMKLVATSGINPMEYIAKHNDTISFNSAEELMGRLNEYVGENGKYTPLVKNVTILIDHEELKEISVVDTPGLNDALASRTDKTKQFIEQCDVVFFLTRPVPFLDITDIRLVTAQLPSKGVENLILVCSRFDDGIFDELRKNPSLRDVAQSIKDRLNCRAKDVMEEYIENQSVGISSTKAKIFEQCKNPVFVSSYFYNMSLKPIDSYSRNEKFVYNKLKRCTDLSQELLREIGNMDSIKSIFSKVVSQKDDTLHSKAMNFVPNVQSEWNNAIQTLFDTAKSKLEILETRDKEAIETQKKVVSSQINDVKLSIETVLGELLTTLENTKAQSVQSLREHKKECSHIEERQGTEWHTGYRTVGQHHFLFWTWGGHVESYNYSTTYTYLAVSDALENVRTFGCDACSDLEQSFTKAVDIKATKKRLLKTILDTFDTTDESFDINYFRRIVESTLNSIEFPILTIDIKPFLESISSKFSGEIKDSNDRANLQVLLSNSIDKLFDEIISKFTSEVTTFRTSIVRIEDSFSDELLRNINDEFNTLQEQFNHKEEEITHYKDLLTLIDSIR
jgi:hypothetical protein